MTGLCMKRHKHQKPKKRLAVIISLCFTSTSGGGCAHMQQTVSACAVQPMQLKGAARSARVHA